MVICKVPKITNRPILLPHTHTHDLCVCVCGEQQNIVDTAGIWINNSNNWSGVRGGKSTDLWNFIHWNVGLLMNRFTLPGSSDQAAEEDAHHTAAGNQVHGGQKGEGVVLGEDPSGP